MKRKIFVLMILFLIVSGCAGMSGQVVKSPDAIQGVDARKIEKSCVETDYRNNGEVFIKVNCHERIIHAVTRLRSGANYAVFIGDDPMMIIKASADGILVFVNQFGRDVEIILEMSDEEIKEIKISPPALKATADKGGEWDE